MFISTSCGNRAVNCRIQGPGRQKDFGPNRRKIGIVRRYLHRQSLRLWARQFPQLLLDFRQFGLETFCRPDSWVKAALPQTPLSGPL
jgi:hypothetical protein